jgi:alkylation response protein AidB-like acyl-CoA dehydrogenase
VDLSFTDEERAFAADVRTWLTANVEHPPPFASIDEEVAWGRQWQAKLAAGRWVGIHWPAEYGGRGASPVQVAIFNMEYARARASQPVNRVGINLAGPTLLAHGTDEQRQRWLPRILTAEEIWCQLYSEPNAGSDLASLRTAAVREGDAYVVNGQKVWTSGGAIADFGVLLARTNPTVPKHAGISYFILDMHDPGVEVRPLKQITGSSEFCEVFFTNVRVPAENLIGTEGQGWQLAQTTLGFERGGNTLSRATAHRANLARLLRVASRLRHNGTTAIEDPVVRRKLGQMLVEVEVLRYGGLRILSKLEKGQRPGAESSTDKLYYSELDKRHQELVQEVLGPLGQLTDGLPPDLALEDDGATTVGGTRGSGWAYNFLWSRAGTIYAGSSEIQKNIIGERVLGLPREPRMDRFPEGMQRAIREHEQARATRSSGRGE